MRKFVLASLCLIFAFTTNLHSYAQSTAAAMGSNPIKATNWSFQCFKGESGCGTNGEWITSNSQPGTVRLWDSGATWGWLNPKKGTYDWQYLDAWLDLVADHQPRAVLYTFGDVPCWIAGSGCFGGAENYSAHPPIDLTSTGSATFNAFVLALVQHCTSAGHCVKDYIKYWELWNEPNRPTHWTGTASQLYDMVKAAVPIIRNHVPGAIFTTPAICGADTAWMTSWMKLENANTRLSNYYSIHLYLNGPSDGNKFVPETRMKMIEEMVNTKNANGWTKAPWINTETNFNVNFACEFSAQECDSQLVRWHILQYAYQGGAGGAFNIGWYDWTGSFEGEGYDTYYYTMMKWLEGASFTASCTSNGNVWTCPLTEAGGKKALLVWNTSGDSNYKPASQYTDYRSFNGTYGGATHNISSGESITIDTFPVMLE
jgi:hypothetical protein